MKGKHCILELFECDPIRLNDEVFIRKTISKSVKVAGATLINLMTHRFSPCGVTALAILAESHISIHTWPEICYGAVDVFTCGKHTMPEKACELLVKEFNASRHSLTTLQRETPKELFDLPRELKF